MRLLLALGMLVAGPGLYAQQQPPLFAPQQQQPTTSTTPSNAQAAPNTDPAPLWLAWKTFHGSLVYYNQKSPDSFAKMLTRKFGLNADQAASLMTAGQKYLSDTQQIELQTRNEVRRRYIPALSGHPSAMPPTGPQTNLDRAKADGLYAEMEGLHQNALDAHLNNLKGKLTDAEISQITTFVQTTVLQSIKMATIPKPPTRPSTLNTSRPPGFPAGAPFPPPLQ
jgi:hypothetical protein